MQKELIDELADEFDKMLNEERKPAKEPKKQRQCTNCIYCRMIPYKVRGIDSGAYTYECSEHQKYFNTRDNIWCIYYINKNTFDKEN